MSNLSQINPFGRPDFQSALGGFLGALFITFAAHLLFPIAYGWEVCIAGLLIGILWGVFNYSPLHTKLERSSMFAWTYFITALLASAFIK